MRFLSRQELLELTDEELLGLAECHGLEVEGRRANEVIDELHDFITDFAEMFGGEVS